MIGSGAPIVPSGLRINWIRSPSARWAPASSVHLTPYHITVVPVGVVGVTVGVTVGVKVSVGVGVIVGVGVFVGVNVFVGGCVGV